jgi:hypothetical protein
MNFINFLLKLYFHRKKFFIILFSINITLVVFNKIYLLYYQKKLKEYKKNYDKLQKLKRKLYMISNYKTIINDKKP